MYVDDGADTSKLVTVSIEFPAIRRVKIELCEHAGHLVTCDSHLIGLASHRLSSLSPVMQDARL